MNLVVIPARGGSKGVPGKNIKTLGGKSLIEYTINAAREIFNDDQIIVSTDSPQIIEIVEGIGLDVPFIRPEYLATDIANTQDVLLHALEFAEARGQKINAVVLLQPTAPFRTGDHIREALKLYKDSLDMVVSVKETESNPYYVLKEENSNGYLVPSKKGNFTRRQDCPKVWELNGAIYIINKKSLKNARMQDFVKIVKYEMDNYSSHDIDNMLDWYIAETILNTKFIQ